MIKKEKRSFFERITGGGHHAESEPKSKSLKTDNWGDQDDNSAQLAVDVYQTPTEVIIILMIAGVKADDLDIAITREMVTIKAKRNEPESPEKEKYLHKELYWGSFGRTIILPDEVDSENSEAIEKNGLLIIKMPKINKNHSRVLKVKSL